MQIKEVVRVATSNNFNCTDKEFAQLDKFAADNPDCRFFVNSNARTPRLPELDDHLYKAVITVNPDLDVVPSLVERSRQRAVRGRVSFFRVKWLPDRHDIAQAVEDMLSVAPVVVTMQRFNSRAVMEKYADPKDYKLECARFRLHGKALKVLEKYVDAHTAAGLYICDRKGLGCLGCGLCATLNGAKGAEIKSLNLSTSGVCPYSCPDCYAKAMQKFLVATGNRPMKYDTIMKNKKQKGSTKHIQNARKARKAA